MSCPPTIIRHAVAYVPAESDNVLPAAFASANSSNASHVVMIDHANPVDPIDLDTLVATSNENPSAMVLGYRHARPAGNWLGHLLLRLETGLHLHDLHGPRVYPKRLMDLLDPAGQTRMGHAELLARAAWSHCPIIEVRLPDQPPGQAGESLHSLSLRQKLRCVATHIRLIARALIGGKHPQYEPGAPPAPRKPFWPSVWRWLNPFAAWRELRQGGVSRNEMAVGMAAGAFIGNMPVWGFHTVISLYVAKRLHLNPLAVMTGSHVSAPPMGPFLVASAMWTGHVILHQSRPKWENITLFHGKFMTNALPLLADWTLGAVIIGTTLGIIVFIISNFLFRFIEKNPDPQTSTLSTPTP